jgi:putative membrane protein
MALLLEGDLKEVDAAVQRAEAHTNAEIAVVVADASDDYLTPRAVLAVVLGALVCVAVMVAFPHFPPLDVVGLQAVLTLLAVGVTAPLIRWVVPAKLLDAAVLTAAHAAFSRHGIHGTAQRSGVLVFVSTAEHRIQLLADQGALAALGQPLLDAQVQLLVDALRRGDAKAGVVKCVDALGAALAAHFPKTHADTNELANVTRQR